MPDFDRLFRHCVWVILYIPISKDFSPQSPDSVLGLVGNNGSRSDFGRAEGTSPLCLQIRGREKKRKKTFTVYMRNSITLPICALTKWPHGWLIGWVNAEMLDLLEVWRGSERFVGPLWWEASRSAFSRRGDWLLGRDHRRCGLGWFVVWRWPVNWNRGRRIEGRVDKGKVEQNFVKRWMMWGKRNKRRRNCTQKIPLHSHRNWLS